MMMCFYQSYTNPVPGLMPHRMKHGFGMEHLSALFMLDPSAWRMRPACALATRG